MSQQFYRAIVVGGSSGIGRELVLQLAASGCQVASVARRTEPSGENIRTYAHDVTDFAAVPALFQQICLDLGGLDLIIYASGVMPSVGPDEFCFEKDKQMVDVNILGAVAWCNEAAQRFGQSGGGTIVGIGSVAGDRGRAPKPVYGASKAFFESYLESLRNRVGTKGVRVVTIKPGPTDTPMAAEHVGKKLPAAEAARQILAAARAGRRVVYVPGILKYVFAIIRALPSPIMQRLKF
ncbi:SDR family NAD(P)-dependent oxidoreductase [Armatimonas sp.]|uniref:SDR family NAD(P)-dependent oxidoreductase n=1 Tax=Armatimonas sp. TaxID=1872638 RepID=UPI00286BEBF3|nr:SDR family NAD(P)-dependent oxidoreductase [Armatimonas sp.]